MKQWYRSRTIWVNLISIVAILIQTKTGYFIGPDIQSGVLGAINLVLRIYTHKEIGIPEDTNGQ